MTTPHWLVAWTREEGEARAHATFVAQFGSAPDGVWSAPGRINLIGEHVDYNGGFSLPSALPHRTYAAVRARADDTVHLVSGKEPGEWIGDLADAGPVGTPGEVQGWGAYVLGVAWALREAGHAVRGFDVAIESCVPYGAGLSSSAALEASVAVALAEIFGLSLAGGPAVAAAADLPDDARAALAAACVRAENEIAGAPTGGMDQAAALRCTVGHAILLDSRSGEVEQVEFDPLAVGLDVLVIDTRAPHELVDGQYAERRATCEAAAVTLGLGALRELAPGDLAAALAQLGGDVSRRRVRHVVSEIARVHEMVDLLAQGRVAEIGPVITAAHVSLRDDYEVSCPELDVAVDAALAAGALGTRMIGGGFGGSAIALIHTDQRDAVMAAVAASFAEHGFGEPAFLAAPPSAPAM